MLVNMTNDGWFGWWRAGRAQHLQIATWRCVELCTPMVRAANTGISCSIDTHGRVTPIKVGPDKADWNVKGSFQAAVELAEGVSIFARGGWITGWVILAGGLVLGIASFLPMNRPKGGAPGPSR